MVVPPWISCKYYGFLHLDGTYLLKKGGALGTKPAAQTAKQNQGMLCGVYVNLFWDVNRISKPSLP